MATTRIAVTTLVPLIAQSGQGHTFLALRANIFPSEGSLRWFVRRHRPALVKAGALVKLRGIWHVDTESWDEVFPALLRADTEASLTS